MLLLDNSSVGLKHIQCNYINNLPFVPFESQSRVLPGEANEGVSQLSLSGIANEGSSTRSHWPVLFKTNSRIFVHFSKFLTKSFFSSRDTTYTEFETHSSNERASRSPLLGDKAYRIGLIGYSTHRTLRNTLVRLAWEDPRLNFKLGKR